MTAQPVKPEVLVMQEYEQNREQRPEHGRKSFVPSQERDRRVRSKQDSQMASGLKRQPEDRVIRKIPTWESEEFIPSESSYAGEVKKGGRTGRTGRDAGKPHRFDGTTGKRKARSYTATTATEPQHWTTRKKPSVSPSIRARQSATSRRSASR